MNDTLRELHRRAEEFHIATGQDLAGLWISQERWNMLPQGTREAHAISPTAWGKKPPLTVRGVPIRVFEVLDPVEAFTRAPGRAPQAGFDPLRAYAYRREARTGL